MQVPGEGSGAYGRNGIDEPRVRANVHRGRDPRVGGRATGSVPVQVQRANRRSQRSRGERTTRRSMWV